MKITAELLYKYNACNTGVRLFNSVFPKGAEITEKNCLKALRNTLNIGFLINQSQDAKELLMPIIKKLGLTYKSPKSMSRAAGYLISPLSEYVFQGISSDEKLRVFKLGIERTKSRWYSMTAQDGYYNSYRLRDLIKETPKTRAMMEAFWRIK
jgi:hypothetical protein